MTRAEIARELQKHSAWFNEWWDDQFDKTLDAWIEKEELQDENSSNSE